MMLVDQQQESDLQSLALAISPAATDGMNAEFYGKYPFPPRAQRLERSLDADFQRAMLCQDLGDWSHQRIPSQPQIWVAGCGTNQALINALAYSRARVLGSDISAQSIALGGRGASEIALGNLQLRIESLNAVSYAQQFDIVICTGVIHHNSDPSLALRNLARALKPNGVLELMVYSRFQRIPSSSVQKAIRLLASGTSPGDGTELSIATELVSGFQAPGRMGAFLGPLRHARPAELADSMMQPVEYTYTVASLSQLANECGLRLLAPVVNAQDKLRESFSWSLEFTTPLLRELYGRLEDVQRWELANLLKGECSPLLWFYLGHASDAWPSEREMCATFLETRFARATTRKQAYTLDANECYRLEPGSFGAPPPLNGPLRSVLDAVDARRTMREVLQQLGLPVTFPAVNDVRLRLTTTAFPYLKAVKHQTE